MIQLESRPVDCSVQKADTLNSYKIIGKGVNHLLLTSLRRGVQGSAIDKRFDLSLINLINSVLLAAHSSVCVHKMI